MRIKVNDNNSSLNTETDRHVVWLEYTLNIPTTSQRLERPTTVVILRQCPVQVFKGSKSWKEAFVKGVKSLMTRSSSPLGARMGNTRYCDSNHDGSHGKRSFTLSLRDSVTIRPFLRVPTMKKSLHGIPSNKERVWKARHSRATVTSKECTLSLTQSKKGIATFHRAEDTKRVELWAHESVNQSLSVAFSAPPSWQFTIVSKISRFGQSKHLAYKTPDRVNWHFCGVSHGVLTRAPPLSSPNPRVAYKKHGSAGLFRHNYQLWELYFSHHWSLTKWKNECIADRTQSMPSSPRPPFIVVDISGDEVYPMPLKIAVSAWTGLLNVRADKNDGTLLYLVDNQRRDYGWFQDLNLSNYVTKEPVEFVNKCTDQSSNFQYRCIIYSYRKQRRILPNIRIFWLLLPFMTSFLSMKTFCYKRFPIYPTTRL
jgi:hypothetical protein